MHYAGKVQKGINKVVFPKKLRGNIEALVKGLCNASPSLQLRIARGLRARLVAIVVNEDTFLPPAYLLRRAIADEEGGHPEHQESGRAEQKLATGSKALGGVRRHGSADSTGMSAPTS